MAVQSTGTRIEFRVLGPLEIAIDGDSVDIVGGRQRALLVYLLLHPNEPLSGERLVEELWGASPSPSAKASLRVAVSKLRQALGEEHGRSLETLPSGYRIRVGRDELDAGRFEALLSEARSESRPARIIEMLEQALALWRGPPLADVAYESFAQNEIRRLTQLRLAACEEKIEAELARGRHERLVPELEALVDEHPLRERLRGQLMVALYRSGRQADALEVYRRGRRQLQDELGLEPGDDLRRL
jgi:DNA-binding SARP family transcriptional activator